MAFMLLDFVLYETNYKYEKIYLYAWKCIDMLQI